MLDYIKKPINIPIISNIQRINIIKKKIKISGIRKLKKFNY
jgi:hypothetical protein